MPEPARAMCHPGQRAILLLVGAILGASLGVGSPVAPAHAAMPGKREQLRFMWAMAGRESNWDYFARNASSGAFGKYQIMPANWPVWAAQHLGDARADQTPRNQERVAYAKIRELYRWLGAWKRVAFWWLTGRTVRDERRWSTYARGYVEDIMRLRRRAPADGGRTPGRMTSRSARGDWRLVAGAPRLRLSVAGRPWARRGALRDGAVVRVRNAVTKRNGVHWVYVVTLDGRLGWLPRTSTLPAQRPALARRWSDVDSRGRARPPDRGLAHPRPQ